MQFTCELMFCPILPSLRESNHWSKHGQGLESGELTVGLSQLNIAKYPQHMVGLFGRLIRMAEKEKI